jgi:hypothetical protein
MKVTIQTTLACAASRAWEEVQKPRLLNHVAAPLVKFAPLTASGFPETWEDGDFFVFMFVFGFLPLGLERIGISTSVDPEGIFDFRDDGGGTLVRSWDHHIIIRPGGDEDCLYCDAVDIRAGALTPLVWMFAQLFYRWRQHRWRRLVASNFQYS